MPGIGEIRMSEINRVREKVLWKYRTGGSASLFPGQGAPGNISHTKACR